MGPSGDFHIEFCWRGYADESHRRISEALAGSARRRVANGLDELNEAAVGGGAATTSLEPIYCLCRQVAFGEMIACDNIDCKTEWFHTACVSVSRSALPDSWMCAECTRSAAAPPQPPAAAAAAAAASPAAAKARPSPRGR